MTGKNPGYHTSTFSSENFPESWCNTKLPSYGYPKLDDSTGIYKHLANIGAFGSQKNKITLQQQQKGIF